MGGHAFRAPDGSHLSVSILRDEIPPTLKQFCSSVLSQVGVLETRLIGSAGKRSVSNDIDVSIGLGAGFEDQKAWKKALFAALRSRMGDCHVKLVGQNISVNYPIVSLDPERQKLRVQIDLIISRNPVWTSWLMSGTAENEIEGVYRNLLLSYLAKASSTARRKVTISYPGGIQTEEHGLVVTPRSEDPAKILAVLGIQGDPESLADFHGMLDALLDQGFDLTGFEGYMAGRLKRAPEQAQRALAVLRSKRDSGPARRPPGEG